MSQPDSVVDLCQACCDLAAGITIENVRDHVVGVDRRVPVYDGREVPYVNFDNAATTPPLQPVLDGSQRFFQWYASVHRGSGFKSMLSTHVYERCRQVVADFLGADLDAHTLIFTQNATHALNKLAMNMGQCEDHVVLTTVMEHHSNMLPWRKVGCGVDYVGVLPDGRLDLAELDAKIRKHAGRLSLVTVTGASNVTGIIPPIRRIARMAHEVGAMMAVDATQLIPHRAFQMGAPGDSERIDFICLSAHKMYAPFGAGALLGPKTAFENHDPDHWGGGTVNAVTMDEVLWAPMPEKEEAGTPNMLGCLALGCVMKVLEAVGMDAVAEHERDLTRRALEQLLTIDGLTLYGPADPTLAEDRLGVITLNADRYSHAQLAAILGHEWGIGVRNGCFCAQPYVRELLGISDAEMRRIVARLNAGDHATVPGMVRLSFGLYNTADEVDYTIDALRTILREGPRAQYVIDPRHLDYVPDACTIRVEDYSPI
ncbi:MAG: aminotransferase class V-fold PLP-dependent enzyme [Planctomycetota bacterium]